MLRPKSSRGLRQVLRWAFIGPLFGVAAASPVIWYFASPFDHSLRSLRDLLFALPIAYLFGVPAALLTGICRRLLGERLESSRWCRLLVIAAGAFCSNYFVWIMLVIEIAKRAFDWDWLVSAAFFAVIGSIATHGMLAYERRLSEKPRRISVA